MALFDSQLSVFKITDTTNNSRDVSPYIISIEGLPGPRELNDATPLNQAGRKFHPSLQNVKFTLEVLWSDDANVGSDTVFGPLSRHTAATAFEYYPEGNPGVKYAGNCWVGNYPILTRVGSVLTARVECQVDGVVARTAG